jgi:hypothetical protein
LFEFSKSFDIEINEGDEVQLENWRLDDPAKDVPTESFKYQVDWGDGEKGPLKDISGDLVINPPPLGPSIIVPNWATTPVLGSGNTFPWGPGGTVKRYQQFYGKAELGGKAQEIIGWGFRYYRTNTWSITYNNLVVTLSHKTTSGLSSTYANNLASDAKQVINQASFTYTKSKTGQDFTMMSFDKPFKCNGKDNLVMEVVYTGGSPYSPYYFNAAYDSDLSRLYNYRGTPTDTTGTLHTGYGLVTKFEFKDTKPPSTDDSGYTHIYRDDPAGLVNDKYTMTVHAYDDDLGHGTSSLEIKVNNIKPTIDTNDQALGNIVGFESGTPSVVLPEIGYSDPGTQYDVNDPNEVWTYWWDLDNDQIMNNAPDVIGTVPQSQMDQSTDVSIGSIPSVKALVNDDMLNEPIALYLLDDDMMHHISSGPSSATGTITVNNVAPVASIEVFIPMEVRLRMTGRLENDLKVEIRQTDSQSRLSDEITIERMPGQPKENPFSDGSPSAPLSVNIYPAMTIELFVTFDANPDANDVANPDKPIGSDPVWVYFDFPLEPDYDPEEDSQSASGHHWAEEFKFNVQQDGSTSTERIDVTDVMKNRLAWLIGHSKDDASDDAQFKWSSDSGMNPLSYTLITYYNDGSPAEKPGAFKDTYPSPWDGTAPCHYQDIQLFRYSSAFSISLIVEDDDKGVSNKATYTLP